MPVPARLLKVGSMAGSLGVYASAVVFQKALALGRVVLFAHLLRGAQGEYGLWGLGMMIFSFFAPLLSLGSNHGLARYVSYYEARGRLVEFYRRVRWGVLACCALTAVAALAASRPITRAVIATCEKAPQASFDRQLMVCWAALGNALLMALYFNLLSFMNGLRVYRMAAVTEVLFGVLFAVLGSAALAARPAGLSLLLAHLASVALALGAGTALLHLGVRRLAAAGEPAPQPEPPVRIETTPEPEASPAPEPVLAGGLRRAPFGPEPQGRGQAPPSSPRGAEGRPVDRMRGVFWRTLRFGLVAMLGNMLWIAASYVSFWLTSYTYGTEVGSVFHLFMQFGQPVAYLSATAWTVVFSHIARHWEAGWKELALRNLQTAFKAVALVTLTLAVLVHLSAPAWVRVLAPTWRGGLPLLPGLLLFYQVLGNLGLVNMLAWLRERPVLTLATAAAAGGLNLLLAWLWLPDHGTEGAAWAAGLGLAGGGGLVAAGYLLATRTRLHLSTYLVMASPLVLVLGLRLPAWQLASIWAALLIVAAASGRLFDRRERTILLGLIKRAANVLRGRHP